MTKIYESLKEKDLSKVENHYLKLSGKKLYYPPTEKIPIIQVSNFPELGKLTALRFIEWVQQNPGGVVSLPTGKTPEHFIKWVGYYLRNWQKESVASELKIMGIDPGIKPDMQSLYFVQIDEFYPIDSYQHNSFYYYIQRYYFKNFDLDPAKAMLINVNEIGTADNLPLGQIFPDKVVDLSLRTRYASNRIERLQKRTIEIVDEFCTTYEKRLRERGGIGFFLGGIGPDGHIGFNVQGSDHFSTTRLMHTNYETQAAASTDLGGIEIARNRLVITIGLDTITHNKEAVAIIIAAGEAKANIIRDSIENGSTNKYPATVLQNLKNARFYLTSGAAIRLKERRYVAMEQENPLTQKSVERAIINLAVEKNKPLVELTKEDFKSDKFGKLVLERTKKTPQEISAEINSGLTNKLKNGLVTARDQVILHTGPHHDDIMLGYLPYVVHLVREATNQNYFATMTSGFTSVTNAYMLEVVEALKEFIDEPDFIARFNKRYFDPEFAEGKNRDVNLYLDGVALHSRTLKKEALARRLVRNLVEIYEEDNPRYLRNRIDELSNYFNTQYPGKKDIPHVQKLKGMQREFEEEIVWGYFGFNQDRVWHLRLGFYQGEVFTETPEMDRDVRPILNLLRKTKPTIVTVALDPEGSGPDTHYKVLQATSEALKLYEKETGNKDIKVWGYRNVWYRFHPAEANIYIPTSINSFAILENSFMYGYGSQKNASFPSHELDGPFCRLAQQIQVEQYEKIRTCLGKDFFVASEMPRLRAAHGLVFLKELTLEEFYQNTMELRKSTEKQ
ncbi:MAG: glucosamine-6-phosphate deaminase [Ignavibacteriales bacterium]|nr:glucosamine-6-phosphate deaminase [Ignavibacteriales bacterium]MCF8435730.1 glucosamine-6-phosphate deaminase [Ignavibacteriales bacterium]